MYKLILGLLLAACCIVPAQATDGGLESLRQTGKAFAAVGREVSPSVVFIQVEGQAASQPRATLPFGQESPFGEDFLRRFFGDALPDMPRGQSETPRRERRTIGQGSGFVFAARDGLPGDKTYILTNHHVVDGAGRIRVKFADGREYDAAITGTDPQSDIAVIEIATAGLPALDWGDSSRLEVGEWVVAIGNPFGLSNTLTVGVVSAKGRTSVGINDYEDFIQTDAAINPGNSGGPLVNLDGDVVGINTAIFSRSGGYMGVGFAIPSNLAQAIADQLIAHGRVTRGFLGIVIQQLTADLAESFDLAPGQGILVAEVGEDSPAARAGLRAGDVILAFGGQPVSEVGRFRNQVALTTPGTRQALTILRDGRRLSIDVTIGRLGGETVAAGGAEQTTADLGLTVQTLTPALAERFDARPGEGVVVTRVEPGSAAAVAGIEPGTLVLRVNRQPVSNAAEFRERLADGPPGRALLLVRQDGAQRFVALSW
jgi:serine protease Do